MATGKKKRKQAPAPVGDSMHALASGRSRSGRTRPATDTSGGSRAGRVLTWRGEAL